MFKNKLIVIAICLQINLSWAQLALNAPYSRFGLGDFNQTYSSYYQSLSGLTNSYSNPNYINFQNPALLNRIARTTMDFGANYQALKVKEAGVSNTSANFGFQNFFLALPIKQRYVMAVAIRPYANLHYKISNTSVLSPNTEIKDDYVGSGSISRITFANSFALIKDSLRSRVLSIGVDASALIGNTSKTNQSLLYNDGQKNVSYVQLADNATYRGYKFNIGTSFRKEIFVSNVFKTVKSSRCDSSLMGKVAEVPSLFYKNETEKRAATAYQTKYAIVFVNTSGVQISEKVQKSEQREFLINHFTGFVKEGFGVLVLKEAIGVSYAELKADYLRFIEQYKLGAATEKPANANAYAKEYLSYGSGIFFNVGLSQELKSDLIAKGTREVQSIRTSTELPYASSVIEDFGKQIYVLPAITRIGFSLDKSRVGLSNLCGVKHKSNWVVGLDISLNQWSAYSELGQNPSWSNTAKIALGGSFTPNPSLERMSVNTGLRRLINQSTYQLSFYQQKMPYKYLNKSVNEIGINFGLAVPTNNDGGSLSLYVGFASRGKELQENYLKTGLGITINESNWFRPYRLGR
jgi:hypothetical protein